jgi:hypothetical protein
LADKKQIAYRKALLNAGLFVFVKSCFCYSGYFVAGHNQNSLRGLSQKINTTIFLTICNGGHLNGS